MYKDLRRYLLNIGLTISTAESCTGGYIGHFLTNVSGSSNYYRGGVISYSDEAKVKILGVKRSSIKRYGTVSQQVAKQMALGAKEIFKTDLSLSITGIAGPTGGTRKNPVGIFWVGVCVKDKVFTKKFFYESTRVNYKMTASRIALSYLYDLIRKS